MTDKSAMLDALKQRLDVPDTQEGLEQVINMLKILISDHQPLSCILKMTPSNLDHLMAELALSGSYKNLDTLKLKQGWCERYPIYALLIESAKSLQQLPISSWSLLAVVLEFCFANMPRFLENPQRLEALCRSLRRLMVMSKPLHLLANQHFKTYSQVSVAMMRLSANTLVDIADRKYAACIATTLQEEWKRKTRVSGTSRTGSKSGKRSGPVLGGVVETDIPTLTIIDSDAFTVTNDVLSVQEQLSGTVMFEMQPDPKVAQNRSSLAVIKDKAVARIHSINITQRLVQANNKNLLSTSIMQSDELEALLISLFHREAKNDEDVNCKLLISLMLWTGLSLGELFLWQYNTSNPGLVCHEDEVYTLLYVSPLLTNTKPEKVELTCPLIFAKYANLLSDNRSGNQLFTIEKQSELENIAKRWLERVGRRSGFVYAIERIQNFLTDRLQCSTSLDPSCIRIAFGTERNQFRVTRYYTQLSVEYVCNALSGLWMKIRGELNDPALMPESFYQIKSRFPLLRLGSSRAGSYEQYQRLSAGLRSAFENYSRQRLEKSIDDLVAYHNHYMEYCCLMLFCGIGCRVVRNPIPSLSLIFDHDLLLICDKDDVDIATRVSILCEPVKSQIDFYLEHLKSLSLRVGTISNAPALNNQHWFGSADNDMAEIKNVLKMKTEVGQFFYLRRIKQDIVCVALTPKDVNKIMQKTGMPANAGRHFLRSELVDYRIDQELINQSLGHWSIGESPFGQWSQLSLIECRAILKPILSRIVGEQGWIPVRSKMI